MYQNWHDDGSSSAAMSCGLKANVRHDGGTRGHIRPLNAITRGAGSGTCCDAGVSCCAWSVAAVVGAL